MAILLVRTIGLLGPMQKTFQRFLQSYDQYQSLKSLLKETAAAAEASSGGSAPIFEIGIQFEASPFGYGERPFWMTSDLKICGLVNAFAGPSGSASRPPSTSSSASTGRRPAAFWSMVST